MTETSSETNLSKLVPTIKWLLVAAIVGIGAIYVVPIMLKLALDMFTIMIYLVGGLGLFLLIPAFCEAVATLGYRLTEAVWLADPITRLRRDLESHQRDIDTLESMIAQANSAVDGLERLINQQGKLLSPASLEEKQRQLAYLKQQGKELVVLRDDEIKKHRQYVMEIETAEAELKIGNAFNQALGAFKFAKKMGPRSTGSQVALASIHDRVSQSQSKLALVLSRPVGELTTGGAA